MSTAQILEKAFKEGYMMGGGSKSDRERNAEAAYKEFLKKEGIPDDRNKT